MGEDRLPRPPPGFIHFHWKTKQDKTNQIAVNICPVCGGEGSVWQGGGLQDAGAQRFLEELREADGRSNTYEIWCQKYEGVMLKEHWSRYGTGKCTTCEVEFWHDFIGYPWHYYYNPASARISHSYTPALF